MGQVTILNNLYNMYDVENTYNFDLNTYTLNNRLFCTFTNLDEINDTVDNLKNLYTIMYNKVFVLYIKSTDEYTITYNVEQENVSEIPENTILVHRKKESNTLYTINALNELIKKLNGGAVDSRFPINWQHYRNSILLTNQGDLKQLNTKIYKIVEL
ncbi:hypothetical protein UFOVP331_25 [uncultured Caudovirales phage]|uniref:Uncharacterized protein n=1 Tax=uncultured Caudovirales phage TaxID=2100421 RepID=A0A6J5LUY6_9CAUD|nr:hypothetical protein UFOVP331_25 [uncultured Caudovirales phage]